MSLSTIKQRIEDYSISLTSTNSGFDSSGITRFLNDAMLDGAKDIVNRIGVISPNSIPKFTQEFYITSSSGVNSDFIVGETEDTTTYITAAITTTQQTTIAVAASGGMAVGDYIVILNTHNLSSPNGAMSRPDNILDGVEIMKVKVLDSVSAITVSRGEFGSVKQTFPLPDGGTPATVNPKIQVVKKIVPIGKVIYAESETLDRALVTRRYPLTQMQPHLSGRFQDKQSLLYQSKYNGVYAEKDNKIFAYPDPHFTNSNNFNIGVVHAVTYGDILDFGTNVDSNTRDFFPEEHLNQVIMFAAIKSFTKVMSYMKNRLVDFSLPAMGALPSDITVGSAPAVDSPEAVTSPETDINITETLGNITFPDSFPLEELDIGSPAALSAIPAFGSSPVLQGTNDLSTSETVDDPDAVTFPAAPDLPSMDILPEFPTLGAVGQVTGDISDIQITIPTLSTIDAGTSPTTPTGLSETFKPEWMNNAAYSDSYTSWGHDIDDVDGTPAVQWSFEHQVVTEEDPELAAIRLRQMEVEVEKFTKSQDTIARVYVAEVQAYAEKIRAEIAKISGEAQIAAEEARAKRTILEAESSKVQAEASIVQSEVQANQAIIQAYAAEVAAKVNKFSQETKAKTDAYVGEVRGLTQIYQTQAQFNIGKFNAKTQRDVNVYTANVRRKLQEFSALIQMWQAEVSSILQRWVSEEWQSKIVKWQMESALKIQEYQSKIGQNVQKYAQEIASANGKSGYEIRKYGAELQKLSTQNQSQMAKYQTEYQMKIAEWNTKYQWSMQRWSQDLQIKLQKYNVEFQKTLGVYQAEAQMAIQEHNIKQNNLNIEYQWIGQQMQILTNMYNASFVPYQQQQQQPAPQMVQRR